MFAEFFSSELVLDGDHSMLIVLLFGIINVDVFLVDSICCGISKSLSLANQKNKGRGYNLFSVFVCVCVGGGGC